MTHPASPTVSVVIPVRNDAAELVVCLGLLARQAVAPFEVVVVDNGSTDDSAAVALAHGARVVVEPQVGIPAAAATGYDAARGDLIARLDADSRPPQDWVAHVARAMADPDVAAVTGHGRFHDLPPVLRQVAALLYLGSYYLFTYLALGHLPLWGSSMAIRRTSWERVRERVHRDEDVHDDMDLAFALGPDEVIRFVPRLRVDVSGRSVRGLPQLRRRMQRGVNTLRLNWTVLPPWVRWRQRWASAVRSRS